jgi:uncharacterized protein
MKNAIAFASGMLFSAGLCVSGMTSPAKILAFLDFTGAWDPSLAYVMAGAVAVAAIAFRIRARRPVPLEGRATVPAAGPRLDLPLVAGAALFGLGWGLSGVCPGPAVTCLASGRAGVGVFVAFMLGAMAAYRPSTSTDKSAIVTDT